MAQMQMMSYRHAPLDLTSPTSPSAMYGSELDLELASLLNSLSLQHKMSAQGNHGHGDLASEDSQPSAGRGVGVDEMESQDISMDGETGSSVSMSDTLASSSSSAGINSQPSHSTTNTQATTAASDSSTQANSAPSASTQAYPAPCPLLQSIMSHLTPAPTGLDHSALHQNPTSTIPTGMNSLSTTNGEYLDLIFMHREMFLAHPSGHVGCPAAFTAMARELEARAWRSDRDGDLEAVKTFRHEAWMTAAWLGSGGMWWGNTGGSSTGSDSTDTGMGRGIGLLED